MTAWSAVGRYDRVHCMREDVAPTGHRHEARRLAFEGATFERQQSHNSVVQATVYHVSATDGC